MITLSKIELDEQMNQDPVYMGGMTAGNPSRTVTVVFRVDDVADIDRVRRAIADLTRAGAAASSCDVAPGRPMLG